MSTYATSISPPVPVTITPGGPPPSVLTFVLVAMENQPYDLVLGDGVTGSSNAPFLASLLPQGATIPHYNGGFSGSSESNYVAMVGGDTYGSSNGSRNIGDCSTRTIVDLFEAAGVHWNILQENNFSYRGGDHNGFLDFSSLVQYSGGSYSSSTCPGKSQRFSSMNIRCSIPGDILSLLNSASPPRYLWITPGDSHNMHDNDIPSGDNWLRSWVPRVLATPLFRSGKAILLLWWDEPCGNNGCGNGFCPNLFLGGPVKRGYVSGNSYDHYSTLRLIENLLGLGTLTTNDAGANPMTEVLLGS